MNRMQRFGTCALSTALIFFKDRKNEVGWFKDFEYYITITQCSKLCGY